MNFIKILLLLFFSYSLNADPINLINFKKPDGLYNFYIEIPAGSKQKWEVNKTNGKLEIQKTKKGKRIIKFIGYPGNYGFIPQTLADDGDPIDVIDLEESSTRGSTIPMNIIGGLYFEDKKKIDIKMIAINPKGNFKNILNLDDLLYQKPAIAEILKKWFLNYKKPGKMVFIKYINKVEAEGIIKKSHLSWKKNNKMY